MAILITFSPVGRHHGRRGVSGRKLVSVSEDTEITLKRCFTKSLKNSERLGIYGLLKVLATKTPQLEPFLREEIPQATRSSDKELAKIHSFLLDLVAPLTAVLERSNDLYPDVQKAVKAACQLLGNASIKLSSLRREKIITSLNKSFLPLVKEEEHFEEAALGLFGTEFAERCKKHVDQVKAMRSSLSKKPEGTTITVERIKPFFRGSPSQHRGGQQNGPFSQRGGYQQQAQWRQSGN